MKSNRLQKLAICAALFAVAGGMAMAADPTNISGVITELDTYKTSASVIGIGLVLWQVGKRVFRRAL